MTIANEKAPPHDNVAEKLCLGSLILGDSTDADEAMDLLGEDEAFFFPEHRVIYRAMAAMHEKGEAIDANVLLSRLNAAGQTEGAGGLDYLTDILNSVPSSANLLRYAQVVNGLAVRRSVIASCDRLMNEARSHTGEANELIDIVGGELSAFSRHASRKAACSLAETLHEWFETMDKREGGQLLGVTTGYRWLDEQTGGLCPGDFVLIGARPSVGKSAMGIEIGMRVASIGTPVGFFSLEMSNQSLAVRLLSMLSGVNLHDLRRNMIGRERHKLVADANAVLCSLPLYLHDETSPTILELRTKARELVRKHGVKLIIVDYLGLIKLPHAGNKEQAIAAISSGLKNIARELGIPVIAMAQLNRGHETETRVPRLSDLRDSGSLEADADIVLLLHRECVAHRGDKCWQELHPKEMRSGKLILAKQRNGPTGAIEMEWVGETARWQEGSAVGIPD